MMKKILEMESGDGRTTMWMHVMPLTCTPKNVQTSSYEINKYGNVTYNMMTRANAAVWYIWKLLRE